MASEASQEDPRVGSVVAGKYKLSRLLGTGGMGSVYEAVNTWTRRRVAIKFLRPELTADRDAALRFMQEAQAATAIAHPHIVEVLDMGRDQDDNALYIVQEFLSGTTLRQHMATRGKLPVAEAVDIAMPVMGALCAAHERGIVHRDLKPENLFLVRASGGTFKPKLIDFGVSKVQGTRAIVEQTSTGYIVGTPRYMSPEQLAGERAIDGRADVWSVAVLLYEMLGGRCPYEGHNLFALVAQVMAASPPTLQSLAPEVPAALAAVIHRAVARNIDDRHADMRSFVEAIFQALEEATGDLSLRGRYVHALDTAHVSTGEHLLPEASASVVPTELFTPWKERRPSRSGPPVEQEGAETARPDDSTPPAWGSQAIASGATLDTARAVSGELRPAAPVPDAVTPARTSRTPWMVAGAAAAALLVGGIFFVLRQAPTAPGEGSTSAGTAAAVSPAGAGPVTPVPGPVTRAPAPLMAAPPSVDASAAAAGPDAATAAAGPDAGATPAAPAPEEPAARPSPAAEARAARRAKGAPARTGKPKGKGGRFGNVYVLDPD